MSDFVVERHKTETPSSESRGISKEGLVPEAGRSLDQNTRAFMEARFGQDFGRVRIHDGARGATFAEAMGATAYTVGSHIVFGAGQFRPATREGRHLLAHELVHVVQQGHDPSHPAQLSQAGDPLECEAEGAARDSIAGERPTLLPAVSTPLVQRQQNLQLTPPTFGTPSSSLSLFPPGQQPQLQLQPWVQAYFLLDPDAILRAIQAGAASQGAAFSTPPPGQLAPPSSTAQQQLVPPGAGPTQPRPASVGDVLSGIVAVPAVRTALTNLRDTATDRLMHDWRSLSTPGRVATIGATAAIASGLIAGIVSNNSARQFALTQLAGKSIPVPGVPGLGLQLNLTGPNQSVMVTLDLSALAGRLGL